MKTFILAAITAVSLAGNAHSQDPDDARRKELAQARQERYPKSAAQIGFIYPLSTNGTNGTRVSNHVSLNALGSYSAALDGAEFSGIFNLEKDYVKGVQFAGIFNGARNEVDGAQFAGIANTAGGPLFGAQFAGIANVTADDVKGAQFAGIVNLGRNVKGIQAGGIADVGRDVKGVQVAGIASVNRRLTGTQIAGILNLSKRVDGVQIGLINVTDTLTGTQIGLINLARNGYRRFEVYASDALHGNFAFRMGGNEHFYNIFAVGATWPTTEKTRWGYGYGIGTNQPLGGRNRISIEGVAYHIHESKTSWDHLNMLNQARVSFIFPLQNRLALTVTPTFNVQVSQLENKEGDIGTKWVSWNVYDKLVNDETRVRMWPGLNIGFQF